MLRGVLYLPGSSKAIPVELSLNRDALELQGEELFSYSLEKSHIHHPIGSNPQIIELSDGARLEISDKEAFFELCRSQGHRQNLSIFNMESKFKFLVLFFIVFLVSGYVLFMHILPGLSPVVARMVPQSWADRLDTVVLEQLDDHYLLPTELSKETQQEVRRYLLEASNQEAKILFRRLPKNLANAFALTGNTVVLTDGLIEEMTNRRELLAVYLHEAGHLNERHALQGLIRSSTLGVVSMMIIGDMPGLSESVLSLGFVLADRSFSRHDEDEADQFAARQLLKLQVSPHCLSDAFRTLSKINKSSALESRVVQWISTHPSTEERIMEITKRYGEAPSCE